MEPPSSPVHPFPRLHGDPQRPRLNLGDILRLRLLSMGATLLNESWRQGHRPEPWWRIFAVSTPGAAVETVIGASAAAERIPLVPGEAVVVPAWLAWAGLPCDEVPLVYLHFDWIGPPRSLAACGTRIHRIPGLGGVVMALGTDLYGSSATRAVLTCRAQALAWQALAAVVAGLPQTVQQSLVDRTPEPIQNLVAWIDEHLDQDLGNAGLARRLGVSIPQLMRLCQRHLGCSPGTHVRARRLARAGELLRSDGRPVVEIARACGWTSREQFSRAFAAATGQSPAVFRRES